MAIRRPAPAGLAAAESAPAEGEVVVQPTSSSDRFGRSMFVASWSDGYLPPDGVRGQYFHTSLDEFVARVEADGRSVRVLPLGDVVEGFRS